MMTPIQIQCAVCIVYGVSPELQRSSTRERAAVEARSAAMRLCRDLLPQYTFERIAVEFCRDKTTVAQACEKPVDGRYEVVKKLLAEYGNG